ncbi:MAG: hypothetical protein R3Y22_04180 [Bacteroidales bacterium]
MVTIAGVMREAIYSPNNVDKDAAIFNAVVEQLQGKQCVVNLYSEQQLRAGVVSESVILNMCRDWDSIKMLQSLEREGRLVINSAFGIENCTRERMTKGLLDNNIPTADTLIVDTDSEVTGFSFDECWVKRGDFHAVEREDVSFCRSQEEVHAVLNLYHQRGIKRAVINKHLTGDLVKFYGVQDSEFFYWFYPLAAGHSKYGHEYINGVSKGITVDVKQMTQICQDASHALNVGIYGGDCVVGEDGTIRIIDFNDFPSFSPCREQVAPHIAEYIIKQIGL